MRKMAVLLVAMLALGSAAAAEAQNVTASITIPEVLSINVSNATVSFPAAQAGDYDASGLALIAAGPANSSVIGTRGNVVHDIEVLATTSQFGFTASQGDPDPGKPVADLEWSSDAGATWTGLSSTVAGDIRSGIGRGVAASAATVQYRLRSSLASDVPGTYSVTFVYSVVAN